MCILPLLDISVWTGTFQVLHSHQWQMAILHSADLNDSFLSSQYFLNSSLVLTNLYPCCGIPQSVVLHFLLEVHEVKTAFAMIQRCYLSCLLPAHSLLSWRCRFSGGHVTREIAEKLSAEAGIRIQLSSIKPDIKN